MLKERARILSNLMLMCDSLIAGGCFFLGYYLTGSTRVLYPLNVYVKLLIPFIALWSAFLYFLGMYESFRVKPIPDILNTIIEAAVIGIGVFGIMLYFLKAQYVSRAFVFIIFSLTAAAISAEKIFLIDFFRYVRKKGYNIRNLLIVGTGKRAESFIDIIKNNTQWGLRITGLVDIDPARRGMDINGYTVLGTLNDIPDIVHNNVIDEVVFVIPRSWLSNIEGAVKFFEIEGVKINIAVDYFDLKISRAKTADFGGFPIVTFESGPSRVGHLMIKRLFDILVSASFLIILSPIFLLVSILVKYTSRGPVFFKQERVGLNGRRFILYKFRTMEEGAETKQGELLSRNEMSGPVFKLKDDPRLTPVGVFLRKFSMDEFPQFWNVLKGDMSIVGPRPPIQSEVLRYDNWQRRRLSMRPGITCIWQVRGRNKITDFDEWMKLDLEYIDNWSIWLDIRIFLRTVPAVISGAGAK